MIVNTHSTSVTEFLYLFLISPLVAKRAFKFKLSIYSGLGSNEPASNAP